MEHLSHLANRLANITECVGKLLQAPGVLGDVHVALDEVAEFGFQVHGAMKLVVAELIMDGGPDRICRGLGGAHDITHIFGDGDVKLAEDALVLNLPVRITAMEFGRWLRDMGGEVEFAEKGIREAVPLIVVGVSESKDDRNMGLDVHHLQNTNKQYMSQPEGKTYLGDLVWQDLGFT